MKLKEENWLSTFSLSFYVMILATVVLQLNSCLLEDTMPNRLKNAKSVMTREFCQFLKDKPFVRNTNTTLLNIAVIVII